MYRLVSHEAKILEPVEEHGVVARVDQLLYEALEKRASDIHLEPQHEAFMVRYRIDGTLHLHVTFDVQQAHAIIARLKVLAALDIAQTRLPQDGKFQVIVDCRGVQDRIIDMRLATFPTLYGEKMVIRLLDADAEILQFPKLGVMPIMHEQLERVLRRDTGLLLVVGPTGSGKTTTLYTMLSHLNSGTSNIVTLEDPIEYELPGINQSQINVQAGFAFHQALRSILRQDPDQIMVGEIRDRETALVAIEAALTGHLVLSTLHTYDALGTVIRLIEMGIEPFLVSAALVAVMAQRLVRRLCDQCKKEIIREKIHEQFFLHHHQVVDYPMYQPVGCNVCHGTGYSGRVGIFELLLVDDEIRSMIIERRSPQEIRRYAEDKRLHSFVVDGFAKLAAGIISYDDLVFVLERDNL